MATYIKLLFAILYFSPFFSFGEGTKKLRPIVGDYTDLYINSPGHTSFITAGCLEKYRLNIHVSEVRETILFGFHLLSESSNYTLKKPHNAGVELTGVYPSSGAGYAVRQILINNVSTGASIPEDALAAGFLKDPLLNPGFFTLLEELYYVNNIWSFTPGSLIATMYWTSSVNAHNHSLARAVNIYKPRFSRYWSSKANAFSVRCI